MPPRRAKTHLTKEDAVKIAKPDHLSSADESAALRQSQPCLRFSKRLSHFATKMIRFNMASALE